MIDKISIVPDSFVTGTVNGVADSKIGFKNFSFNGLDAFSQYNPQIYISKSVVTPDNASSSYNSIFTLNTDLTESQYKQIIDALIGRIYGYKPNTKRRHLDGD